MRTAVAIIRTLAELPSADHWQRADGLRCSTDLLPISAQPYRWTLRALVWLGIVERKPSNDLRPLWQYRLATGIYDSYRPTHGFRLTNL